MPMKKLITLLIILALPTASLANIDEIWTCYDKNIHVVVLQPTMSPNYKDKDRISSEDVFKMLAGIHRKYPELKIL